MNLRKMLFFLKKHHLVNFQTEMHLRVLQKLQNGKTEHSKNPLNMDFKYPLHMHVWQSDSVYTQGSHSIS